MPRNTRNFWIDAEIDGRSTTLEGGPVARDGGLDLSIRQRRDGEIACPVDVLCRALPDGRLRTVIRIDRSEADKVAVDTSDGSVEITVWTER